jgi:hypothetical protein
MDKTPEIKNELKRIFWDYSIDEDVLYDIYEGKTSTFSLNKEKLYSRLLMSTKWYKLLDCFGLSGVKEMLTDEAIGQIWIHDIREKYNYAKKALHGLS